MSTRRTALVAWLLLAGLAGPRGAVADPAPFDLEGPTLDVSVTRAGATLPLARVPGLARGDRLILRPGLPSNQSARYLMVAAFLRGPTNPPPEDWFYRCETWKRACLDAGLSLTVPGDAQQLIVFFAPQTGGDFRTLVGAVRGKPGAFVRAAQELNQAALDRMRLEHYLAGLRALEASDPARLKEAAPVLARSLGIKVNEKCLERKASLQAACLMEGRDSLILNDGHGTSMVATLTSGPASDLAMQVGNTPAMAGGYSPYIGSVIDFARLMESFRTAKYQYIPALVAEHGEHLVLMLNTPPSFHDPQSVLVASLPPIEPVPPPALRPVDRTRTYCDRQVPLVLPVDGAPLAFATSFAHGLRLVVTDADGASQDLPVSADALSGGLLVDTQHLRAGPADSRRRATLRGHWGFDTYEGPSFELATPSALGWSLPAGEEAALIVGREDVVRLGGAPSACLSGVSLQAPGAASLPVAWSRLDDGRLELTLPLTQVAPGPFSLHFAQHGAQELAPLVLNAFADAGHLDAFVLHAGDTQGALRGGRLDLVESLTLRGAQFMPAGLTSEQGRDELTLAAVAPGEVAPWRPGDAGRARVRLKDGRTLGLDVVVGAPRPRAVQVSQTVVRGPARDGIAVDVAGEGVLPADGRLTFSLRAEVPAVFARDERVEVATADESLSVALTQAAGTLSLQSPAIAVATLDPARAFGIAAFGPLKFRRVAQGVAGDWSALATLVRLPRLTGLACQADAGTCVLSGSDLFLIEAASDDPAFGVATHVPDGYTGNALRVRVPAGGAVYLRLRDEPAATVSVGNAAEPAAHPDTGAPPSP